MFNIVIDYKPTYTELVSFLDTTDFYAPVLLNDYAEKVLYNATFVSMQDENDALKGLSITYMNRPQKDYAYLTYIAVCKDVRKMGGGRRLLLHTIETTRKQGFRLLRLEVKEQNKVARHLYESFGFIYVSKVDHSYYMELKL